MKKSSCKQCIVTWRKPVFIDQTEDQRAEKCFSSIHYLSAGGAGEWVEWPSNVWHPHEGLVEGGSKKFWLTIH